VAAIIDQHLLWLFALLIVMDIGLRLQPPYAFHRISRLEGVRIFVLTAVLAVAIYGIIRIVPVIGFAILCAIPLLMAIFLRTRADRTRNAPWAVASLELEAALDDLPSKSIFLLTSIVEGPQLFSPHILVAGSRYQHDVTSGSFDEAVHRCNFDQPPDYIAAFAWPTGYLITEDKIRQSISTLCELGYEAVVIDAHSLLLEKRKPLPAFIACASQTTPKLTIGEASIHLTLRGLESDLLGADILAGAISVPTGNSTAPVGPTVLAQISSTLGVHPDDAEYQLPECWHFYSDGKLPPNWSILDEGGTYLRLIANSDARAVAICYYPPPDQLDKECLSFIARIRSVDNSPLILSVHDFEASQPLVPQVEHISSSADWVTVSMSYRFRGRTGQERFVLSAHPVTKDQGFDLAFALTLPFPVSKY